MDQLMRALARRLENNQAEPAFMTRITFLILALCVLAALLL
jgi:hypothetical protein